MQKHQHRLALIARTAAGQLYAMGQAEAALDEAGVHADMMGETFSPGKRTCHQAVARAGSVQRWWLVIELSGCF